MDWIQLRNVEISCIIGILEHERAMPQPLSLEVAVEMNLDEAAHGDVGKTLDYRDLLQELRFLVQEGAWGLIESVAAVVLRHLLRPDRRGGIRQKITRARVSVAKPRALNGAALPCVRMERATGWYRPDAPTGVGDGVELTVLLETAETGAYVVDFDPYATWVPPVPLTLLVLAGTLKSRNRSFEAGQQLADSTGLAAGAEPVRALAVARGEHSLISRQTAT